MMRPELPLLLLLSLSSSLHLSAALCVPRNSSISISSSSSSSHAPPTTTTTSTPPISPPTTTTTTTTITFPTATIDTTSTITSGVATSLAKSLCGRTDFPGVCISTVTPLIYSFTGFLDAKSLLSLTLKAMPSKVKSVQAAALKLQAETKSPTSDSYKLAVELLGNALDEIDAATAAIAAGDKASVGVRASGLSDYFDDIDNDFMELDEPSPIADDVHQLWQMSANCLALTDFAYKKS